MHGLVKRMPVAIKIAFYGLIASSLFLQRFAFVVSGFPIQMSLLVGLSTLIWLVLSGYVKVDRQRLILFLMVVVVFLMTFMLNGGEGKLSSMGLLFLLYSLYLFKFHMSEENYKAFLLYFQKLMAAFAVFGLLQFALQFFIKAPVLFSFYDVLPDSFLAPGFNTAIPLHYGSEIFKSNGFLMLEPSIFSQYLALAVLIELLFFGSVIRLGLFVMAMLFSYSGTGLILLALFLPLILIINKKIYYGIGLLLFILLLPIFDGVINLDIFIDRAAEFETSKSSGFERFIGPFFLIKEFLLDSFSSFLIGIGPGSISEYRFFANLSSHDPSWAKLFFEYGFIGLCVFYVFFLYAMFSQSHSKILSAAILVKFLILGGYLLDQGSTIFLVALISLPSKNEVTTRQLQHGDALNNENKDRQLNEEC